MSKQNIEFKDSGIPWIGQIPKHWKIKRLKFILNERKENNKPVKTDFILSLTNEKGVIPYSEKGAHGNISKDDITGYKLAYPNDIILNSMNVVIGSVGLSSYFGAISPVYYALYSKENSNIKFYNYIFQTSVFQNSLKGLGNGILEIRMRIPMSNLNNVFLPLPPLNEQEKIAEFLDKKCEIIDKRLSNLERKIKSLKEYKKSLISECVTTGLNPTNMEFKDSGIPWCPQIPSDWQVINPKILFKQRNQKAKSGEIQYTASQEFGIISQEEYTRKTGYNMVKVLKGFDILKHVEVGDFVISMRSFQGGLEYSNVSGSISSAYVMLIPNSKFVNNRYFRWLFKSSKYIDALQSTTNLIRDGQAMRYSNFALIKLIVPSLNEQKEIAEFLDKKCEKIDRLNENYTKQITALKEYKKSLIYECVTGKKEI